MKQLLRVLTIIFFCFPLHGMMNKLKLRHVRSYRDRLGKQIKIDKYVPGIFFKDFPEEIDLCILNQMPTNSDGIGFYKTLQGINSLAQTNKFLNKFINDPRRMLAWIKQLSSQFGISNLDVAAGLLTKAARKRFIMQDISIDRCSEQKCEIYISQKFDLEFTYGDDCTTPLFGETNARGCKNIVSLLIKKKANINACDIDNRNALMARLYCADWVIVKLLLDHTQLHVDHQDNDGNTALHYCIMGTLSPEYKGMFIQSAHHLDPALRAINTLLAKGANPNLKNNDNRTPLEHVLHIQNSYNDDHPWIGRRVDNSKIIKTLQQAELDFNSKKND